MGVTAWLWRGEQYIIGRYLFCYCLFPRMAILMFVGIYKNLSLRCLVLVSLSMPVTEARLDHFYPPPIPLWALTKPRRVFHPFFGKFSLPHNPDVITSSPSPSTTQSSSTYTTPSTTPSTPPPPTNSCRPDPVTDNLPWDCIDIIQALRDGENLV